MKWRHQTQVTVWPAITDLMTAIVVVAVLGGLIGYHQYVGQVDETISLRDSIESQKETIKILRDSVDSQIDQIENLYASVDSQIDQIENLHASKDELQDSVRVLIGVMGGLEKPPCMGLQENEQPNVLMTIGVYPENIYSLQSNFSEIKSSDRWPLIEIYFNNEVDQNTNITFKEINNHAQKIYELSEAKGCVSYVILRNGGVSRESLVLKWIDLERYNLRLANPGILR